MELLRRRPILEMQFSCPITQQNLIGDLARSGTALSLAILDNMNRQFKLTDTTNWYPET